MNREEEVVKANEIALEETRKRMDAYRDWMLGYAERALENLAKQLEVAKSFSKQRKIIGRMVKWNEVVAKIKSALEQTSVQASTTEQLSSNEQDKISTPTQSS